jgi:hypothetical protein
MTNEEWAKVKEALQSQYRIVKLNVDGYEVALVLSRISTYKLAIVIYINGVFEGKWLQNDCEERRRFLQKKEHSLLTRKDKESWKKLSKKTQREFAEKYDLKYEVYSNIWTSVGALKKHLATNNKNIELISIT